MDTADQPLPATLPPHHHGRGVSSNPRNRFESRDLVPGPDWDPTEDPSPETIVFEGRVGGRIVERARDGTECVWGTVTAWEPPRRVAFTWHPGQAPETAQDVEVRFEAEGELTRVQLVHTGFERLGSEAKKARRGYPIGWAYVLGLYAEKRGPFMWFVGAVTSLLMSIREGRKVRDKHVEKAKA